MFVLKGFLHAQEVTGMTRKFLKPDSKSGGGNIVLVRVRPGAPISIFGNLARVSRASKTGGIG
jgi:hypothetical protein